MLLVARERDRFDWAAYVLAYQHLRVLDGSTLVSTRARGVRLAGGPPSAPPATGSVAHGVPNVGLLFDAPAEFVRIVALHYSLGIVAPIEDQRILQVSGVPALNGAFTVEKQGTPEPGEHRQSRFIMDMAPANCCPWFMTQGFSTPTASAPWLTAKLEGHNLPLVGQVMINRTPSVHLGKYRALRRAQLH